MGPNYSISTACATSNFCILNAANHIRRGEAVSNLNLPCSLWLNFCLWPYLWFLGCYALWWIWCTSYSNWFVASVHHSSNSGFCNILIFVVSSVLTLCNAGLGGFVACRALSQRNSDPTKASRPWDMVSIFCCANLIIKVVEWFTSRAFSLLIWFKWSVSWQNFAGW